MSHSSSAAARKFLKLNGAFSLLTAAPLLFAAGWAASLMFADPAGWMAWALRGLGIGLVGFAGLVYALSTYKFVSRFLVNEIVVLDVLWVIASIVLVAGFGHILTPEGMRIIVGVAAVVAFFAVSQFIAAAQIKAPIPTAKVYMQNGKLHATVKRAVQAPVATVWEVMTDHPGYADVADNLSKVEVLSGEGLGMVRRCYGPKGESWKETCDLFKPGETFGFRIHTEADDYPYPFAELSGRWRVQEHQVGSEFHIEIVAKLAGSPLSKWLFATLARPQFTTVLIDLADAWAERMEREAGTGKAHSQDET